MGTVMARPLTKLASMLCWKVVKADKLRLNSTDANTGVPGMILHILAISFWTACSLGERHDCTHAHIATTQLYCLVPHIARTYLAARPLKDPSR